MTNYNYFRMIIIVAMALLFTLPVSAITVTRTWNQSQSTTLLSDCMDENYKEITCPHFNFVEPWASMGRVNNAETQYQTMVQVKKYWYKVENIYMGGIHWMNFSISDQPISGYKVHPWFIINNTEVPVQYIGAYEGSIFNITSGNYVDDPPSVNSHIGGDLLSSVAGTKPVSGLGKALFTLHGFRNTSHSRGVGWELQSFNGISAIQLLYIIEKGNWDSQFAIGTGVTQIAQDGSTNMAIPTGLTGGSGMNSTDCENYTCSVATVHYQTNQNTNQVSYRGIEALWGNIWEWVDEINIKSNRTPWVASYGASSDVFSGSYIDTGITLPASNGYISDIAYSNTFDWGFLLSDANGFSNTTYSTYIPDYYYQATGNRAMLFGGYWSHGASAGIYFLSSNYAPSSVSRVIGSRLAFTPPLVANFTSNNVFHTFIFDDKSYTINTLDGVSGSPSSWNWSFGDGNISTERNPTYTYLDSGVYLVNLTVSDGTNYATKAQYVNSPGQIVLSQFIPSDSFSTWDEYEILFTDVSTGNPNVWKWSYRISNNDPYILFNTSKDAIFFPPSIGDFAISLNASNSFSYNISPQITYVHVVVPDIPVASFNTNTTTGHSPLNIQFADTSIGNPTSWLWVFTGDEDDIAQSTLQNPLVMFSDYGLYSVNLTVSNGNGTTYLLKQDYIEVLKMPSDAISCPISYIIGAFTMLGVALIVVGGIIVLLTFLISTSLFINVEREIETPRSGFLLGGVSIIIFGAVLLVLGIIILSPILEATGC